MNRSRLKQLIERSTYHTLPFTMLWPVLVFFLTIFSDQQSITKAIRLSFIRMCKKEKEGAANSNESWIHKTKGRFKFNFGAMEASIMLHPNYKKDKSTHTSSKWPYKDQPILDLDTYPNSAIVKEKVITTGIALIFPQNFILGRETSPVIRPFKSNEQMEIHDRPCDAATESQMNSCQPRAQLRKEVRRPRTRHKADNPRTVN